MDLGNESTPQMWAKLITSWQAINQAQTELHRAKINQSQAFERLLKRIDGQLPEHMIVVLNDVPYIIHLDIEEYRIIDIEVASIMEIRNET